ncbi:MAG: hypothetical protein HUU38_22610 [Anaerolineales bacterium]|nr:hypothetical protein [Anaerolineales bacterium]
MPLSFLYTLFMQPLHYAPKPTLLLLAQDFDARLVTTLATYGRQAGYPVILTGLIAGPIRSHLGVVLFPDRTLDTLGLTEPPWVIIPGTPACAQALGRDPRVRRLCQQANTQGGQVFAVPEVYALVEEAGLFPSEPLARAQVSPWFADYLPR